MAYVRIPSILQRFTNHQDSVQIHGHSGKELITELLQTYPSLKPYLIDTTTQQLSHFVNIYLNTRDIRHFAFMETAILDHDVITIIPALAGG